jgi:hypothetical protein
VQNNANKKKMSLSPGDFIVMSMGYMRTTTLVIGRTKTSLFLFNWQTGEVEVVRNDPGLGVSYDEIETGRIHPTFDRIKCYENSIFLCNHQNDDLTLICFVE